MLTKWIPFKCNYLGWTPHKMLLWHAQVPPPRYGPTLVYIPEMVTPESWKPEGALGGSAVPGRIFTPEGVKLVGPPK